MDISFFDQVVKTEARASRVPPPGPHSRQVGHSALLVQVLVCGAFSVVGISEGTEMHIDYPSLSQAK